MGLRWAVVACLAVLAVPGTPQEAFAGSPFSKGIWGPPRIDGVSQFPIYKDLRVNLYMTTVNWADVAPVRPADPSNPADPAYRWPADHDFAVQEARAHGMAVMMLLIGAPPWANGGRTWQHAPLSPADFANFARAASRRYPAVRRWQIWGEPSKPSNFQPLVAEQIGKPLTAAQARAPRLYARILDAAYGALKAHNRTNVVIGGNTFTTGAIRPGNWIRHMRLPDGRRPRMDLYGHNPFSFRRPNLRNPPLLDGSVDFSQIRRFARAVNRNLRRRGARRIKLILTEWNIPTGPDREFNFHVSPATQARWITTGLQIARREPDVVGLGWVSLRDEAPSPDGAAVARGGLLEHNGARKPGYEAFKRG